MSDVTVLMPMAGRGSRFKKSGFLLPKPLVDFFGKPLFFWATIGILEYYPKADLKFVVLSEHVKNFHIDKEVYKFFPEATVFAIDEVTGGALETVMAAEEIIGNKYLIINDCDHVFKYPKIKDAVDSLIMGNEAFLTNFQSSVPHFSYSRYDKSNGLLLETKEKEVISQNAIAGIYGFRGWDVISKNYSAYNKNCTYSETYISGLYNEIVKNSGKVLGFEIDFHFSLGTPEELNQAIGRGKDLFI